MRKEAIMTKDTAAGLDTDRQTLSITEAGKILGTGRNVTYEAVRTGQIPSIKIGHRRRVPMAVINRMLNPEG